MATSGMVVTNAYDSRYIEFAWSRESYSNSGNSTTIKWTLTARGSGKYSQYKAAPFLVEIDGVQVYYSASRITTTPNLQIASGRYTIYHNTDGTKSFSVNVKAAIYYGEYNCYGSGKFSLDSIYRGAVLNSAPNITDEMDTVTINYSNPAGNSATTLRLYLSLNNTTEHYGYWDLPKTGKTYTATITDAIKTELRRASIEVWESDRFPVYFAIETTIGSYSDWKSLTRECEIVDCAPTVEPFISVLDEFTEDMTDGEGVYYKDVSQLEYTLEPTYRKGASLKSCTVKCGSFTSNRVVDMFFPNANKLTYTLTDTRNKTVTGELPFTLINYVAPTCNLKASIALAGEQAAEVTLEVSGNFFNGDLGAHNNNLYLEYRYKANDAENWQAFGEINDRHYSNNTYTATVKVPVADYRKTYTFQVYTEDDIYGGYFDGILSNTATVKAIPIFDWSGEDFNFNVPISFNGEPMADFIIEQGTEGGWIYRKWSSGVMECWRRLQITESVSSAWGGWFTSGMLDSTDLDYPFEFTELPVLSVSLMPFGAGGVIMAPGYSYGNETHTGALELARGTSVTNAQFLLSYYAIGKYK